MNILGISAYHHESTACLLFNGEIVAAVKEESLASLSIIISCGFEKSRSLV
jgi:predicted NodU family carbamoyl transferase